MSMPEIQRSTLHGLIHSGDYTCNEIAKRVGCSRATVGRHAAVLCVVLPKRGIAGDKRRERYLRLRGEGLCVRCTVQPGHKHHVECAKCRAKRGLS